LSQAVAAAAREGDDAPTTKRAVRTLAEGVTTLFLQHAELAETVRDFYAYLGQVLTRNHLAPDEIAGFRNLLVEYIQLVVEDVLRHTPAIAEALSRLAGGLPELLGLLAPTELGGTVERARGRTEADWDGLTGWFVDRHGRPSQVTALRDATARAIGALLATVKRATSGGGLAPGRRAELVELAGWFDRATPERAAELYAAAFGLHSARNLLPAPEHDGDDERTAWADGPVHDVAVSVRSRGDRTGRGRTSRIVDDPLGRERLLAQAREADVREARAAGELADAADDLTAATLSADAMDMVCELLTMAMAQRERAEDPGEATDVIRGLRLRVAPAPGEHAEIRCAEGTLTLTDTALSVHLGKADT